MTAEITQVTPNRKVELFLKFFHTIQFKEAFNLFNSLDKNDQQEALKYKIHLLEQKKINSFKDDVFWMIFLPCEQQFSLLTRCNKNDLGNFDIDAIMNSRSIEEHIQWLSEIDTLLNTEEFLITSKAPNNFYGHYLRQNSSQSQEKLPKPQNITLNKVELFALGKIKYDLFKQLPKDKTLSKEEMICLSDMPTSILEKLRLNCIVIGDGGFHPESDYRIEYRYNKPMTPWNITQYSLKSCRRALPSIIASLMYSYHVTWYFPRLFERIQDPMLIAENKRKELANIFINQLQDKQIPGSEFLKLENINEIPFSFVYDGLDFGYIIGGTLIILMIYNFQPKYLPFCAPIEQKKTHWYITRWQSSDKYHQKKNSTSYLNKYLITLWSLFGWIIPFIPYPNITYPVIILSSLILVIINGVMELKNKTKSKVIDFTREDLKELSVKNILKRYLNKKTKIIL